MGCFSGCLMSTVSDQKFFCELCSAFNCSFDEFVGEKVVSPSYSSAILTPPAPTVSFLFLGNASHIPFILHVFQFIIRSHTLWSLCDWFIVWLHSLFFLEGTYNSSMAISFFQSLFWRLFKVMHNVALLLRLTVLKLRCWYLGYLLKTSWIQQSLSIMVCIIFDDSQPFLALRIVAFNSPENSLSLEVVIHLVYCTL